MRKIFIVFLVVVIGTLFSSCMMMMPDHMSGSMQEGHNHDQSDAKIDPVCGKQVGNGTSFTYESQGNIYYFDSEQCLSVFKSNPDHFMQKTDKVSHKKTWTTIGWIGGAVVMTSMMVLMLTNSF